jgi:hypothetical protein
MGLQPQAKNQRSQEAKLLSQPDFYGICPSGQFFHGYIGDVLPQVGGQEQL